MTQEKKTEERFLNTEKMFEHIFGYFTLLVACFFSPTALTAQSTTPAARI